MMRVLHCIYDDPANPWVGGGGALRAHEIYKRLTSEIDVEMYTGAFPGAPRRETVEGVSYRRLGFSEPYLLSRASYGVLASHLLSRGEYDVGVFDFSGYTPVRVPAGRPVAIVVHMLHGPTAPERWGRFLGGAIACFERWMLHRSEDVCTTSAWMLERLDGILDPPTRLHLVHSGISRGFFEVKRQEQDYLLFFGRFDVFQKGIDVLLEAFAAVRARHPELKLHVVGRGREEDRIGHLAEEAGVGDAVTIRSRIGKESVRREMAGALALVVPSRFEGLPMVPAEAMAAGVPVIATEVGAVREVVDPPRGGTLVPPGDAGALAEAIEALLSDPERRRTISSSARSSARRFDWDRVAHEHLSFLNRVAARRGGIDVE